MSATCDTSVLVPALVSWHPGHDACREAALLVRAVPAHVLVETYSVLTRLPAPHRLAPLDAADAVTALPFTTLVLPSSAIGPLIARLGVASIRGGATYDAMIAATTKHHGLTLLTRDRRARQTYEALGADYSIL